MCTDLNNNFNIIYYSRPPSLLSLSISLLLALRYSWFSKIEHDLYVKYSTLNQVKLGYIKHTSRRMNMKSLLHMVNGLVMMFKVYFMDDKIVNCDEVYWRKMAVCVSL